jgi:phosphomethylpyrimidine synthase
MNKNLLPAAIAGNKTSVIGEVADREGVTANFLIRQIASGRIVVMQRDEKPPLGIGEGLKTKINANIGTSAEVFDPDIEVEKARIAEKYGADTVSDLSMGGDIDAIRQKIIDETNVPLTTVPIYQTVVEKGSFQNIAEQDLIRMIKKHVGMGISSIVVHAGFTLEMLEKLRNSKRIMGIQRRVLYIGMDAAKPQGEPIFVSF